MIRTDDLSVTIRSADGTELHFSTTSDDPSTLCTVANITTKDGTGFESAQITVARDATKRYDDLGLLQEVVIEGVDGKVLHEGTITGTVPEVGRVQINSTGKFAMLKDKSGFSDVYVDADVSKWGGPPSGRQGVLLAANYSPASASVDGGTIKLELGSLPWTNPGLPATTACYVAPPGVPIGSIECDLASLNGTVAWTTGNADYNLFVYLSDDDDASSPDASSDRAAAIPTTATTVTASTSTRRFAWIEAAFQATVGTSDSVVRGIRASNVKVKGAHGLTTITPSTVIQDLIDRYCPGLTYDAESITEHPYEIGQLVFEGVSPTDVIAKVNSFANWDFNVWEGGKCWYGPHPDLNDPDFILGPTSGEDGDTLDPDGRTVSDDFPINGVEVFYTDVLTGYGERIGPDDDYRLTSTDDENPCNRENRDRWGRLDISFPCNEDDAIQIGSVWLAEHLIPSRVGSGKAIGTVTARNGQRVPAANIRAGDVVRYADEDYGRKVYSTNYQPSNQENTLTFDDAPATFDAILERIGIEIILLGSK